MFECLAIGWFPWATIPELSGLLEIELCMSCKILFALLSAHASKIKLIRFAVIAMEVEISRGCCFETADLIQPLVPYLNASSNWRITREAWTPPSSCPTGTTMPFICYRPRIANTWTENRIEQDRVGDVPVRYQFNQDETWTKAMKFMLTDIKSIVAFFSSWPKKQNKWW